MFRWPERVARYAVGLCVISNQAVSHTKYINSQQIHFNILCVLFTVYSPTCFDRYPCHLHDDVLITRIQLWLTVSPSLRNNYNYIIFVKII